MSKRMISFLLVLLLLSAPALPARAEDSTAIRTPDDLLAVASDPRGSYYLDGDLDMTGVEWIPLPFFGSFDGRGHTIYNLRVERTGDTVAETVDGNAKVYPGVFAGLFSVLDGAEVRGVSLRGVDIEIDTDRYCYIGGIAGYFNDSKISDCSVEDARLTLTSRCLPGEGHLSRSCAGGAGGIVGFGSGEILSCRADVVIVFDDKCDRSLRIEQFMGGILACGNALIDGCSVTISGWDACHGYAHNGGLVGMFYSWDKKEARPISRSSVAGQITFFEDNADRRAYCEAFVGEMLTWTSMTDVTPDFRRNEIFDYSAVLRPERCAEPVLTETVRAADCSGCGYTEHTCTVCGNTWRDRFVPETHEPGDWEVTREATYTESGLRAQKCRKCGAVLREEIIAPHTDGDWVTVREPDFGVPGLMQLLCADCGAVLAEEPLPARIAADRVTVSPSSLEMDYKSEAKLEWTLSPENAELPIVYFSSSDERVATVEANGTVHAVGNGTAVIACVSADGFARAECTVTVRLTLWQWIRQYLLFGWVIKH